MTNINLPENTYEIDEFLKIKLNCNLVMIDFLVRHGKIRPEDPFYTRIISGLRGGLEI